MLGRIQRKHRHRSKNTRRRFPEETGVDANSCSSRKTIRAKLFHKQITTSSKSRATVRQLCELERTRQVLAASSCSPAKWSSLKIAARRPRQRPGPGYLTDGTMVVVNNAQSHVGRRWIPGATARCKLRGCDHLADLRTATMRAARSRTLIMKPRHRPYLIQPCRCAAHPLAPGCLAIPRRRHA